jgi:formylglycine-generating enzyme required for sulfatase activity
MAIQPLFKAGPSLVAARNIFAGKTTIGEYIDVVIGEQTARMIYANNLSSITFPSGTNDAGTETLTRKMFIQETDFTNAQAVEVLQWAYDNSKFSATVGDHNGLSSATAKWGGQELLDLDAGDDDYGIGIQYSAGAFSSKAGYANKPLVNVSWYGAIMLCNWFTEMKDGSTVNLVYAGIDTTWVADETTTDLAKVGYRLPTSIEWWYCARYRGADNTNIVAGYSNPYFTQGDSASGATADYTHETETAAVAVYNTGACASVKSKTANTLGLYDMTGNVWEWLENYEGNGAYDVGSCWERAGDQYLEIGTDMSSNACNDPAWDVGFRMAKTQ